MKISPQDRVVLLLTALLAAWQIAIGIDDIDTLPMIAYTVGFGVLVVASLLIIILGFEALDSPIVVVISTIIPLSLSLGLFWEYLPSYINIYLIFVSVGFLAILLSRVLRVKKSLRIFVLAIVHGVAGLTIFLLPFVLTVSGRINPGFALVGVGGALIGLGGLLLTFLRMGKPILPRNQVLRLLPGLWLLMTTSFVAGFALG